MHATALVTFAGLSSTAIGMCCTGVATLAIGGWRAPGKLAMARGLDKIVALGNLCFAIPLAVFGALHVFGPHLVLPLLPGYMPWRSFWIYSVGFALIAASLSIATDTGVRWSGLLFGVMMFLFVAMIHLPGALGNVHDRFGWTIVFREMSFGGAAWLLAGTATDGWSGRVKATLIAVGRVCVAMAVVLFGFEHLIHPTGLPGVPLRQEMPMWLPGRVLIDYVTGAALLLAGGSILLRRKTRTAAALLGGWLLVMVVIIYGPFLIASLAGPGEAVQVQGINYFADTLLFAGVILALAKATPL